MKLNITDASKAVGKPRSTLYRHIKRGKVSSDEDGQGNTVIDISELQRVYGKLNVAATDLDTEHNEALHQPASPKNAAEIELLRLKLKHAEEQRNTEKERRERAENEVERLLSIVETQTRQLAAPTKAQEETPIIQSDTKLQPQKRGLWSRIFGG